MEIREKLELLCRSRRIRRSGIVDVLNESGDPRLATSKATVGRWFSGESEPSIHQLCFLCRFLGTTIGSFCSESGEVEPGGPDDLGSPTPDESLILTVVRRLGQDRALDRLLGMDAAGLRRPSHALPEVPHISVNEDRDLHDGLRAGGLPRWRW